MSIQNNIDALKKDMPSNVNLIAVSKTKPMEDISEAYSVGIRDFGENKVQEMINKYDNLDKDIRWHFIGHLQRNKVKYLVSKVYLIHSLDSIELLKEIEKQYGKKGDVAKTLIQINIGDEKSKTGIKLNELDLLLKEVEKSNCVKVMGLMAIIPKGDENSCREYFRKMKNLFNDLEKNKYKNIKMVYLSMGMTNDYRYAIDEGSNMIRVGEGIFGKRIYNMEGKK